MGEVEFDIVGLWREFIAAWKGNFFIVVVCGALLFACSYLTKPLYRAEIIFMPVSEGQSGSGMLGNFAAQFGGLASLAGIELPSGKASANLAILKSREFTNKFIEENNLLPVLFEEAWDKENNKWKPEVMKEPLTLWHAYGYFDSKIRTITSDTKTGLVTLTIKWKDPNVAATWANELVVRANAYIRARAIEQAEKSTEYLQQEVARTNNADMRAVLYKLIEKQKQAATLAQVKDQFAFQVIDPAVVQEGKPSAHRTLFLMVGIFIGLSIVALRAIIALKMKSTA